MTRTRHTTFNTGGIVKITRNSPPWKHVQRIAIEHIPVSEIEKMDGPLVGPIRLMDLKMHQCMGQMFFLTLRIRRIDGLTVDYELSMWHKACGLGWEVDSFSRIEDSERGRPMPVLRNNKKTMTVPHAGGQGGSLLVSGLTISRRSKNPFWSYKKVIKGAKGKSQKLTELEKGRFMGEAAKKDLKGKQKVSPKKDLEGEQKTSPQ